MRKWLILFMVISSLIIWWLRTNYLYTQEEEKEIPCDMKTVKSLRYCESCGNFLKGYLCSECKKKALKEKPADLAGKPSYLFYEEEVLFGKCPVCGKKLRQVDLVDRQGKCIVCGEKPKKMKACIKKVFACPAHPDKEFLSPGKCHEEITDENGKTKKCGQRLEVKYISRAKVELKYVCSKCGYTTSEAPGRTEISPGGAGRGPGGAGMGPGGVGMGPANAGESAGKCPECGAIGTLIRKLVCEKSGEFPHVSQKEWAKRQKNQPR